MGNSVSFNSRREANEYEKARFKQGYDTAIHKVKKTGKYYVLSEESRGATQEKKVNLSGAKTGVIRSAAMIGKGISDVGKSLGTPSTSKRIRIAQLPSSRHEIGIAQSINQETLKMKGLRGTDISGRRIK